jgi:nucleotide-binding universal stress UspA family protein
MKRILVGVDGSKESREAVRLAAELARATESLLVIASAVPPPIPVEGALELIVQEQEWERKERERANELVKEVAASIGDGLKVETLVVSGAPAIVLADLAEAGEVELVVVSHRGRNAVARALLGSVADRLVQISPKPVLVVR